MAAETEHRCFIGGLSWETTDRDLEEAFRPYGNIVEAKVIVSRDTGRSKGFGFVTFSDEREMEDAIQKMHGFKLDGRSITVDKAQGRSGGGGGGGGGGGRFSGGGGGGGGNNDGCFKCGQSGHWARDCPSGGGGGGGRRDGYGGGRGDRGDRYGGGGKYGGDHNGDRYGSGRSGSGPHRENGGRDHNRYSSGGPNRGDGGYRDRAGPYDRESGGKYGGGGGGGRNDRRPQRSNAYDDRE